MFCIGLIGSCIGLFFIAALYEGLKWMRERLMSDAIKRAKQRAAVKHMHRNGSSMKTAVNGASQVKVTDGSQTAPVMLWYEFASTFESIMATKVGLSYAGFLSLITLSRHCFTCYKFLLVIC